MVRHCGRRPEKENGGLMYDNAENEKAALSTS
jgi:hypothetical protein